VETTPGDQGSGVRLYVSGLPPSALPEAGSREPDASWWQTPYGAWRLSVEVDAMRERFPSFRLAAADQGQYCWAGRLRSSIGGKRYAVRVTYPWSFPDEAPVVTFDRHRFPSGTPHLLNGNRPCLYLPSGGPRNGYDPARTTAATMVAWTALWIHAYETWKATEVWPGRAD
jgi:hypothetical protein